MVRKKEPGLVRLGIFIMKSLPLSSDEYKVYFSSSFLPLLAFAAKSIYGKLDGMVELPRDELINNYSRTIKNSSFNGNHNACCPNLPGEN